LETIGAYEAVRIGVQVQESTAEIRHGHIASPTVSEQYGAEEQTIPKLVSSEQQLLSLQETNLSFLTG